MSKKVNRWLEFGKKRCVKGDHWFVLDFGDYLLCPICGQKKEIKRTEMPEYNCWIVREVDVIGEKE